MTGTPPIPPNVVPFPRDPSSDGEDVSGVILGKLSRKDFELWVCRTPAGTLSLKWWRWSSDDERFSPLEDGQLSLDSGELKPLAELLSSVSNLMKKKGLF